MKDIQREKLFHDLFELKRNTVLLGAGGVGKSYTIDQVKQELDKRDMTYGVVAPTGIAAVNIGGQTIHRWSGAGIFDTKTVNQVYEKIMGNADAVERWRGCDVLIVDEISMIGGQAFDILDSVAKRLRKTHNKIFGGIRLLLCGDFLQLPPIHDDWLFQSTAFMNGEWSYVNFTIPKRYDDISYFELLQRIRYGKITQEDYNALVERCRAYKKLDMSTLEMKPTFVFSKRKDAQSVNDRELSNLEGVAQIFTSTDSRETCVDGEVVEEFIEHDKSEVDVAVQVHLALKTGALIILKHNLDVDRGMCNGARGIILDFLPSAIRVRFENGEVADVTRHTWKVEVDDCTYKREQYPFILGYAVTVHSCQGMTLASAVIDIGNSIFSPAQAYVALSRVKSLNGLYISKISNKSFMIDNDAVNFMLTTFRKTIWCIVLDYDKDAADDLMEMLDNEESSDVKLITNSEELFEDAKSTEHIKPTRRRKLHVMTEQDYYAAYRDSIPSHIYIMYEGDEKPVTAGILKQLIDEKITTIELWRTDV